MPRMLALAHSQQQVHAATEQAARALAKMARSASRAASRLRWNSVGRSAGGVGKRSGQEAAIRHWLGCALANHMQAHGVTHHTAQRQALPGQGLGSQHITQQAAAAPRLTGEEDGDGAHAVVQVVVQVGHLLEHALAHLAAWGGRRAGSVQQLMGGGQGVCSG